MRIVRHSFIILTRQTVCVEYVAIASSDDLSNFQFNGRNIMYRTMVDVMNCIKSVGFSIDFSLCTRANNFKDRCHICMRFTSIRSMKNVVISVDAAIEFRWSEMVIMGHNVSRIGNFTLRHATHDRISMMTSIPDKEKDVVCDLSTGRNFPIYLVRARRSSVVIFPFYNNFLLKNM